MEQLTLKKIKAITFLVILSMLLQPVSAHRAGLKITEETDNSAVQKNRVRYYLPKQLLHFTVNYDVWELAAWSDDETQDIKDNISHFKTAVQLAEIDYKKALTALAAAKADPSNKLRTAVFVADDARIRSAKLLSDETAKLSLPASHVLIPQIPLKLELLPVADKQLAFVADYNDIQGLVTDAKSTDISLTDSGCLKGVNVEYLDETGPIVGEVGAGLIKIGKTVAKMAIPTGTGKKYKKLDKPIAVEGILDLADATTPVAGLDPNASFTVIKPPNAVSSTVFPNGFQPVIEYVLTPVRAAAITAASNNGFSTVSNNLFVPNLFLYLTSEPTVSQAQTILNGLSRDTDDSSFRSHYIIVRQPDTTEFVVTCDRQMKSDLSASEPANYCVLDMEQQFAQTGHFAAIGVRRHALTDTTIKFTCNGAGAITEINSTRTSTLKTIADAFKLITDAL
jgi:hypothetical protein